MIRKKLEKVEGKTEDQQRRKRRRNQERKNRGIG